jgi:dTDP-4-amino-4,6-dideoxygalactose transaminase
VQEALASNWSVPLGPQVDAFEPEAEALFARGLCLPPGSILTATEQARVVEVFHRIHAHV